MNPVFVPPTKVLTFFYIGFYSLMVIQDGYGNVEGMHLTELIEPNIEEV
jgi:hypothetical protein